MDEGSDLTIWLAEPKDVHEIMDIALMACEENALGNADPNKLLNEIWPALHLDNGMIGAIGKPGGMIEGVVLLRTGTLWYSRDITIEEKSIFIHPDFRNAKGGRAVKLARFAKHVSDELGIPLLIGVLSSDRTAAKTRMYRREFGEPQGAYWIYNGATGHSDAATA